MNDQTMTTAHAISAQRKKQNFFRMEDLNNIASRIEAEPVPERPANTAAAMALLAPVLRKARDKGHTLTTLVKICEEEGLHVSERAISRAISTARASKAAKKKTPANAA